LENFHLPKRITLHFHVITLHWSLGRLKDLAAHSGFGNQADETTISGKQGAYYVTKYTSKQGDQMPKGYRRVRLSHGWPALPELPAEIGVLVKAKNEQLPEYFLRVHQASKVLPNVLRERWLTADKLA